MFENKKQKTNDFGFSSQEIKIKTLNISLMYQQAFSKIVENDIWKFISKHIRDTVLFFFFLRKI